MKSALILSLGLGLLAFNSPGEVPSVNALTETLSRGPWGELPSRTVAVVRHAKAPERRATTIVAVKAALGLNPAAATAVVGAIARALPDQAAPAAETAVALQPKQAGEIARAAAAGARSVAVAGDIVSAVCRVAPTQYEDVAVAVSAAVPGAGKEILQGLELAEPDLKSSIDPVLLGYRGNVPSVALVLAQARGTPAGSVIKFAAPPPNPGNGGGTPPGQGGIPPGQYKKTHGDN